MTGGVRIVSDEDMCIRIRRGGGACGLGTREATYVEKRHAVAAELGPPERAIASDVGRPPAPKRPRLVLKERFR